MYTIPCGLGIRLEAKAVRATLPWQPGYCIAGPAFSIAAMFSIDLKFLLVLCLKNRSQLDVIRTSAFGANHGRFPAPLVSYNCELFDAFIVKAEDFGH